MKRILILIPILLLVLLTCSACENPIVSKRKPCNQPNTKWKSEDGSIVFTVDSNHYSTGTMIVDNDVIEFSMVNTMGTGMCLFAPEVLDTKVDTEEDEYEYWECSFKNKKKFIATVERTTYFNIGDKITFYRVNSGSSK